MKSKTKNSPGRKPGLSQVKVRKANYNDKSGVLEISKNLWQGHDYLPQVWDEWLRDKKGLLLVATTGRARVGVAHAYFQTPDVVWLEGVRVHADYRGLGIAGKLNNALVKWAVAKGAKVARLATGSSNRASRRNVAKVGFSVLQVFQRFDSSRRVRKKPTSVARQKGPDRELWEWLLSRPEFFDNRAMYSDGWTWYPLSIRSFKRLLRGRQVLVSYSNRAVSSICTFSKDDRGITLGFAAGSPEGIERTVRFLRHLLHAGRGERLRVLIPKASPLVHSLGLMGFEKTAKVFVFERLLS